MQSTVKMPLKGKKLPGNGQHIYDSVNKIDPRGSSVPAPGLHTCI